MNDVSLPKYRILSLFFLISSMFAPFILHSYFDFPWMSTLIGFVFYTILAFFTFLRLRISTASVFWILLMIPVLHFGPKWEFDGISLYLSGFLNFVPVFIGWFANNADGSDGSIVTRQRSEDLR